MRAGPALSPPLAIAESHHGARVIPEFPDTTRVCAEAWGSVAELIKGLHPPISEHCYFTVRMWLGLDAARLARLGPLLLMLIEDHGSSTVVVTLDPQPTLDDAQWALLAGLLRHRPGRFLSARTAACLGEGLRNRGFAITPERDDADYLFAAIELAEMQGPSRKDKRRDIRRLERRHEVSVVDGLWRDPWVAPHLSETYGRWLASKGTPPDYSEFERAGLQSWAGEPSADELRVFGLVVDGRAAGISIVSPMWGDIWMGLVLKTDPNLPGATAYLRRHIARAAVRDLGDGAVINIQQDDGSLSLRRAKSSYGPLRMEPKYSVHPHSSAARPC